MRPIERGPAPDPFSNYAQARDPLVRRIGDYCSYCENALHADIDVEHVRPKSRTPRAETEWSNFLLACGYCNSVKGSRPLDPADYLWPDTDNTFLAFEYVVDLPPSVAGSPSIGSQSPGTPSADLRAAALRTLALTGLDRGPGHPRLSPRDRRWIKRREAWGVALLAFRHLRTFDTPQLRDQIVITALSRGFFSVWMTVFQDDPDMRRRFVRGFPGTAPNCFDAEGRAVPRPGGKV